MYTMYYCKANLDLSRYHFFLQGESCENPHKNSLILLQSTLEKKYGYGYSCSDLYGDPTDPRQTFHIARQAAGVIQKLQYYGEEVIA